MTETESWTSICQDSGDGTGDVIVDIPPELIARLGLGAGDLLTLEVIDGVIVLTPQSRDSAPT
jgi:antitoxin component of MazEF toxin-antitoxin module